MQSPNPARGSSFWLGLKANFHSGKLSVDKTRTDKKMFLCVKVISSNPELTRQRKIFLSVPIHG